MNRGLYIGATSLVTNQRRLDVLSNNLANVNTAGYKKDISLTESFPEKLLSKMSKTPEMRNIPGPNNITYENNNEVHTARTQEGYFTIGTSRGKSYVKEIKFVVDDEGYLKTSYKNLDDTNKTDYENYILDRNGNRIQGGEGIEQAIRGAVHTPASYVIGTMSGGVRFQKIVTDFTVGNITDTGGALDLAIKGDGFFKVQGEDGQPLYSRNGSFAVTDGYLTDLDGRQVLGRGGAIQLPGGEIDISSNGTIFAGGTNVGQLDIVNIDNKEHLRKRGDNLYEVVENGDAGESPFDGEVLQGYLETSNMNPISGMVEMITLMREFEANQKVVKMQDEMLERAANEIGKV